jgi:endonuclease/exonuclease/phosphatase family metal-dependent hydrolase
VPVDQLLLQQPPAAVTATRLALRAALDERLPAKQLDRNVLLATWNLRAFGGLTKKWRAGADDSPKRDYGDLAFIAEIVSRFDVTAVQEVRGDLRALRHLLKLLGPDWGFTLTDVTKGNAGNNERMAFLFDSRRVKPSGLACELVVPVEADPARISAGAFNRQFARTPYAVSFLASGQTLILVTLHIDYGSRQERTDELTAIAHWLAGWAEQEDTWNHNLIALGDFNIDRRGDPLYEAFTSTGLTPAPALNSVPRTIFQSGRDNFYDQIAWFTDPGKGPLTTLPCANAGSFDFVPLLQGDLNLTSLSWKLSDHYPLWVEFTVPRD